MESVIVRLGNARIDGRTGEKVASMIDRWKSQGARVVVLDVGPQAVVEHAGARALAQASAKLGGGLRIAGLNARGRALVHSLRLDSELALFEWWSDAVA
jgi:hypothetical protein